MLPQGQVIGAKRLSAKGTRILSLLAAGALAHDRENRERL
jgi:hypothetical protein